MIITRLIGGLGNQMFQYAVALNLAKKNNTDFKLDVSGFEKYKLHKYALEPFNINAKIAAADEIKQLTQAQNGLFSKLRCKVLRKPGPLASTHIKEKELFIFDPSILQLKGDFYFEGSWQNPEYFIDINSIILDELSVSKPQLGINKRLAEKIYDSNSIAVHIRRCDYITNKHTNQSHGVCDLNYYDRTIRYIAEKIEEPKIFIFSDDPGWVSNNLKMNLPSTYVVHNSADKNYEDLRLMSQCKHQIIANSTFSWWGAWFNKNPEKIVIAPKDWFSDPRMNAVANSLIPDGWVRL